MKIFMIIYAIIGLLVGGFIGVTAALNKDKDEDLIQYICLIAVTIPGYVILWPVGMYMVLRGIINEKES